MNSHKVGAWSHKHGLITIIRSLKKSFSAISRSLEFELFRNHQKSNHPIENTLEKLSDLRPKVFKIGIGYWFDIGFWYWVGIRIFLRYLTQYLLMNLINDNHKKEVYIGPLRYVLLPERVDNVFLWLENDQNPQESILKNSSRHFHSDFSWTLNFHYNQHIYKNLQGADIFNRLPKLLLHVMESVVIFNLCMVLVLFGNLCWKASLTSKTIYQIVR